MRHESNKHQNTYLRAIDDGKFSPHVVPKLYYIMTSSFLSKRNINESKTCIEQITALN